MPVSNFFSSTECTWGDFQFYFNGVRIAKIRGYKYGVESDDEELYAEGNEPIDIQMGNAKVNGEFKVLKGALDAMNAAAVAAGYDNITKVPAKNNNIVLHYKAGGSRALQTKTIFSVKIGKYEEGMDQGAKMVEVTLPFKALKVKEA